MVWRTPYPRQAVMYSILHKHSQAGNTHFHASSLAGSVARVGRVALFQALIRGDHRADGPTRVEAGSPRASLHHAPTADCTTEASAVQEAVFPFFEVEKELRPAQGFSSPGLDLSIIVG